MNAPKTRSFGLFLFSMAVLAGCSANTDAEVATSPAEAPAASTNAAPIGTDDGAASALANDSVPGIKGCSGTYACSDYRKNVEGDDVEVTLRATDGECWAEGTRLMPDGTIQGLHAYSDGFWDESEGGFAVRNGYQGLTDLKCFTKSGSTKSGPKTTSPHCRIGDPWKTCLAAKSPASCAGVPGCTWSDGCTPKRIVCTQLADETACSSVAFCTWK